MFLFMSGMTLSNLQHFSLENHRKWKHIFLTPQNSSSYNGLNLQCKFNPLYVELFWGMQKYFHHHSPSYPLQFHARSLALSNAWLFTHSSTGLLAHWLIHLLNHSLYTIYKVIYQLNCFNTLRPRQNGHHFPDNIFKYIFLNENVWISLMISLTFVPNIRANNIPALVQIMAWCWSVATSYSSW